MPSLPITARLGLAHDMYLAGPPVPLQRAAFRVLAHASLAFRDHPDAAWQRPTDLTEER